MNITYDEYTRSMLGLSTALAVQERRTSEVRAEFDACAEAAVRLRDALREAQDKLEASEQRYATSEICEKAMSAQLYTMSEELAKHVTANAELEKRLATAQRRIKRLESKRRTRKLFTDSTTAR